MILLNLFAAADAALASALASSSSSRSRLFSSSNSSFLKPGKVVIVLRGRYAGKKGVILQNYDNKTKDRAFGHALIAGIEKYPLKVTRTMGLKKIAKRSRVKPFMKVINHNHLMPTRYGLDIDFSTVVKTDPLDRSQRRNKTLAVKKAFQERYNSGKNRWFFTKLRF